MFCAAHVPLGEEFWGNSPRGLGLAVGKGKLFIPSAWKPALRRPLREEKEQCLFFFLIETACAVPGQPVDHCTGGFLKWPLGTKLNLFRPDAAEEMDEKAEGNLQREHWHISH